MQVFVLIILAVASLVVIGPILYKFVSSGGDKGPEVVCQESVALRAASAVSVGSLAEVKTVPLLCKTIDKEISGNRKEIKEQLAAQIDRCWWMFNEGRTEELISTVPGLGGGNDGFICYTTVVLKSRDFKEGESIPTGEFADYLAVTPYSKISSGKTKKSHLEYIQSYGGPGRIQLLMKPEGITPQSAFEIAFVEKKKAEGLGEELIVGGVGGGAAALAAAYFTGGGSLAIYGVATVSGFVAGTGATIELDKLGEEREVSTIVVLDMSNQELREKFHKHVTNDLAGE